jgi:hypothetical protein
MDAEGVNDDMLLRAAMLRAREIASGVTALVKLRYGSELACN